MSSGGGGGGGGMTVRELLGKIGFEINDEPMKKFMGALDSAGLKVAEFGLSVGAAALAVFEMAHKTGEAGEEMLLNAQRVGMSVEQYQRLAFAARVTQVSTENMMVGIRHLSRAMFESVTGNQQAFASFARLGVGVVGANGKLISTDQALMKIADRFALLPDGPEKAALAVQIFGRAGDRLIPLLSKGSKGIHELMMEADELGGVMSAAAAHDALEFEDSLKRLKFLALGLRNAIGAGLLPSMKALVDNITLFLKENRTAVLARLNNLFQSLTRFVTFSWKAFKVLLDSLHGFAQVFGGVDRVVQAFSVFAVLMGGGAILGGIGRVTMAVYELTKAFALANVVAAAIPLAIGAAVVLMGLAIEDMVGFFQGKDSLFGRMNTWARELGFRTGMWMKEGLSGTVAWIKQALLGFMSDVGGFFTQGPIGKIFGKLFGGISGDEGPGSQASSAMSGMPFLGGLVPAANAALNMSPSGSQAGALAAGPTVLGGDTHVTTSISVAVPPNTPAQEIPAAVERGVDRGLSGVLRGAARSFPPAVAAAGTP